MSDTADTKTVTARGNTRSRAYSITINNWSEADLTQLKKYIADGTYVIGKEVGEQGTPHLQACVQWKNARYFSAVKKALPRAHIEKVKKWEDMTTYCMKEGDYEHNIPKSMEEILEECLQREYAGVQWKPWQEEIIGTVIHRVPDRRTVNWIWEATGNVGKTFLCRYLVWKYKCIIVNGKQADVFNGVKTYITEKKQFPELVVCDIPRTNEKYVCYSTLEKLKDGVFYSGKYEGGQILLPPLHVVCFANFPPEGSALSADRWAIREI